MSTAHENQAIINKFISSDGGPVFPVDAGGYMFHGLTVRAYLAGQALAGLCANEMVCKKASEKAALKHQSDREAGVYFAEISVAIADALLAELAKEKT